MRDFDEKIVLSKAELIRVTQENSSMETQLKSYGDKVPINELQNRIKDVQNEIKDLEQRLNILKSSNVPIISKEEKNKVWFLHFFN